MKKNILIHWRSIVLIVVAIIIVIVMAIMATIGSKKEWKGRRQENFAGEKPKLWALSFGGGGQNYIDAVNRISLEMRTNTTQFDEIVTKTDEDLKQDPEFWPRHGKFIEANKRGYGYWLWKPYLIMKTMELMNDGDILFYVDSGCELLPNEMNDQAIAEHAERCDKNTILYTLSAYDEKKYNKMDLVNKMISDDDEQKTQVMNTLQNAATIIVIKKTDKTYDFASEWYAGCCTYHNIDDSPSKEANDPSFVDHRHDQSVFSLLTKSKKYRDIMNNPENKFNGHPFSISRKRNG